MRWARWLVDHAVTVVIGVGTILIFGIIAYITLPREAAPDVDIPVVLVNTYYFGVSPEDIESLITVPIERELSSLKDVDKMTSTSAEGASIVALEFSPDVDIEDALQKVREKVDTAEADLPEDAEDPMVMEISFSDFPILIVAMTGPYDEEILKELGEDLQEAIEDVPGVLDVTLSGGLDREIKVQADPDRMRRYEVSFNDIIFAIQSENVNIPGGNVDAQRSDYLLRVPGEFTRVSQIAEVPIKNVGGETIFVRDVARVVDGYSDRATYSRMNGTPSISIGVTKRVGENIVEIADQVRVVAAAEAETWPEGVEYSILADQSREIAAMVGELENNIISGLLLVVIVLLFFMGFRNSLFVGLAIPLSMFMSFMILDGMGLTLNMVVLFSLILALGMLVDNAIVIVENIYRHVEEGKALKDASVIGVSEVAIPVATSTLTTVLAFAPMLFWEGIMGQFMGYLPKTLIIVLCSSLFVALVAIPTATSVLMKVTGTPRSEDDIEDVGGLYGATLARYRKVLEWSIDHRYLSIGAGFLTLLGTFVVYGAFNHGTEFFPETEPNRAIINIEAPDGTRLDSTDEYARQIEAVLEVEPDIDTYVTETGVGGGDGGFMPAGSSTPNQATITVDFFPGADRAREGETTRSGNTFDVIDRVRVSAEQAVGATIKVDKVQDGPPVGLPVSVEISGDDFHELGRLSEQMMREINQIPGVVDLDDNYKVGRPELRFSVDRAAAKKVGANTSGVANTIRTAVAGTKASVFREGDEEYDIIVELAPAYKSDIQDIMDLRVPGKDNLMVPLGALASAETLGGSGSIPRMDQDKTVTISGDVGAGYRVDLVQASVKELVEGYELPEGYSVRLGGANEEEVEAAQFLLRAFAIAVCLIFLVLVTQFDSVTRPFIIMASVVLSLIGVLWGLLITGTPFGIMMTGVGVISLAGVVVNNAIVLLDYVQQMRDRGHDVREALIRAGLVRFRPVILTAITTILGLIPMATGVSVDFRKLTIIVGGGSAQFWGPMAVAVCFGLAVATVLTLVMVPTMYSINEDFRGLMQRVRGRRPERREQPQGKLTPTVAKLLLGAVLVGGLSAPASAQTVTLGDALIAAQQNNLDLKVSEESALQAQMQIGQAWSLLFPKLQAQGNYTYNKDEIAFDMGEGLNEGFEGVAAFNAGLTQGVVEPLYQGFGQEYPEEEIQDALDEFGEELAAQSGEPLIVQAKDYFDANISVVQPLFSASALFALRGAYDQRDAAQLDHEWAVMQVRSGTAKAYYGLVVARESVDLAERSLQNAQEHLSLARRQVEAGAAAPIAELQAEIAVSRAQRELESAYEQVVAAERSFVKLTGLSADSQVAMPTEPPLPTRSLGDALQAAAEDRPDILAAGQRVQAAQKQLRYDQAGWLPTVEGRFTYSWTENEGFAGERTWWLLTANASWTLWDGGYRLQSNRIYASQARQADLMQQKAMQDAEEQVYAAWKAYERAAAAYDSVRREVQLAEESLRLANLGFEAGSANYLEVQDAQLVLDQARVGELAERMNRDLAVVDLAVAMGGYSE